MGAMATGDRPGRTDLEELRDLALAVAGEAAELLRAGRRTPVTVAATKSSDTDVVTEMDRASERLIVTRILAARPDDGLLGEEGSDRVGSTGIRWVIDPLDGTVNYLYGLPSWAVSIGVERDGESVVGVVAVPTLGETYAAVLGGGATLRTSDGTTSLRVNDPVPLDRALVGTGFGYQISRRRAQAEVARHVVPQVRDIRRAGACATDLCHLAAGRLDAFYEVGPQPWDHVAGGLIAREAGARTALIAIPGEADPLVVAAGPALFGPLQDLLVPLHRP
jgi:myo-inositol-1(or 4)-monophosphatase